MMISLRKRGVVLIIVLVALLAVHALAAGAHVQSGSRVHHARSRARPVDIASPSPAAASGRRHGSGKPLLQFHDGRFRILQLTDTHYGMAANMHNGVDEHTRNITRILLAAERPDLVVWTGDTIMNTGANCSESWFREQWAMLVQPLEDAGVPWAWISGNHDDEYCSQFPREWLAQQDMQYALSLTGYTTGITGVNYLLSVASEKNASSPAAHLWMLDSGSYGCATVTGYGCVERDQVEWYEAAAQTERTKNGGILVSALAFTHIPLQEYMAMLNQINVTGAFFGETICCSAVNTGVFASFKSIGDVQLVSAGHDHQNDYGANYDGISLFYGRKTGYASGGPPGKSGARVFELTESPFTIHTWVREDDGGRVDPALEHSPDPTQLQPACTY